MSGQWPVHGGGAVCTTAVCVCGGGEALEQDALKQLQHGNRATPRVHFDTPVYGSTASSTACSLQRLRRTRCTEACGDASLRHGAAAVTLAPRLASAMRRCTQNQPTQYSRCLTFNYRRRQSLAQARTAVSFIGTAVSSATNLFRLPLPNRRGADCRCPIFHRIQLHPSMQEFCTA
jgi:hypothetical protein